jgi:hypothetical protein
MVGERRLLMGENRFFKIVWRINGVAIMFLLFIVIGVAAYHFIKEIFPEDAPAVITNVADDPQGEEKWTIGSPKEIEGTNFIYIPLVSEKKNISIPEPGLNKAMLSTYGYFAPSRNLLFVNKQTREMKWLFKGNKQLIAHIDMLSVRQEYDRGRKIDAILYQVIVKDTNSDKQLNSEDLADVAISLPDGSRYKEVLQSVEHIFGAMSIGKSYHLQSKGRGYASTIRLQDMSVIETKEMPKIEQTP